MERKEHMLTKAEVAKLIGLSISRLDVMLSKGEFPPPAEYPNNKTKRFYPDEVYGWLDNLPRAKGHLGRWAEYTPEEQA